MAPKVGYYLWDTSFRSFFEDFFFGFRIEFYNGEFSVGSPLGSGLDVALRLVGHGQRSFPGRRRNTASDIDVGVPDLLLPPPSVVHTRWMVLMV